MKKNYKITRIIIALLLAAAVTALSGCNGLIKNPEYVASGESATAPLEEITGEEATADGAGVTVNDATTALQLPETTSVALTSEKKAVSVKDKTATESKTEPETEVPSKKEETTAESTTVPSTTAATTSPPSTAEETSSAPQPSESSTRKTTAPITTTTWKYTSEVYTAPAGLFESRFYYKLISPYQRELYRMAYEAVKSGSPSFSYVTDAENIKTDLSKAVNAMRYDFPEFCSLNGSYSTLRRGNNVTVTLKTRLFCTDVSGSSYRNDIINKAQQIAAEAKRYSSAFDRIKYVHDYLCRNVAYDYSSYKKNSAEQTAPEQMSNSAYGALINGKALCGGISYAFELIMQQLGYECGYISGTANGGSHAWNMVGVGGRYYCIDITFDDHIEKNKDYIQYDYFCITSAEMNRNHTPAKGYTYPVADSNDMNFYLHNGYVVDRYTSELSCGIVESQSRNGYIYIKFTNREAYLEAKNNSSELFSDVRRVTGKKTVTYYTGDEFYTIAFKT